MAYTKNPALDTYKTQRINFVGNPQARNGTVIDKDQRFVNMFPEAIKTIDKDETEYYIKTRAGLDLFSSVTAGEGRGMFYFNGSLWSAVGNTLYQGTTSKATLGNSTGKVGFTLYNGTYDALIAFDGIKGWVIKTDNTVTQITDADFPSPHLPTPVFIDGYLVCVKANSADIYNSDLENPLAWNPANFITAEMYPDTIVAMFKNKNYLCAVGQKTTEFFYDAAIDSGSPFARNDSFVQYIGAVALNGIANSYQDVVFIGSTSQAGRSVWQLSGVKATEIGIEPIRQILDAEGTDIANAHTFTVRTKGHEFFVINLTSRTLVVDLNTKMWHEWAHADGSSVFPCNFTADNSTGSAFAQHVSNGNIFTLVDGLGTDEYTSGVLTPITSTIQTIRLDFGSINRKTCSRFSLIGDSPNGATSVPIQIQWADDDYITWSALRELPMTENMMTITQLGGFRRRAFKLIYSQPYPLRLAGFEVDLNLGTR